MADILKLIHDVNPFEGFIPGEEDMRGWGGHPEFFESLIAEQLPSVIVEVGTWKGRSAIAMADAVKKLNLDTKIICVDTWLGATEFWTNHADEKRYRSLLLRNGYPQVYYTFLSNVVLHGHQDIIVPFPQTSLNAARFMSKLDIKAELIYVDASHEYEDVAADLKAWWSVLDDFGTMFGDDYCKHWDGVIRAVDEFAFEIESDVQVTSLDNDLGQPPSDYWILDSK